MRLFKEICMNIIINLIMKTLLLLLAVVGAMSYETDKSDIFKTLVCDTWRGWGEGFASVNCGISINSSCEALFDVIPELIDFFTTFDFSKLGKLVQDIYTAIKEGINQFNVCNYFTYFVGVFGHLYRFLTNFLTYWQSIQADAIGFISNWAMADYYHAGICLGRIWKVILAA